MENRILTIDEACKGFLKIFQDAEKKCPGLWKALADEWNRKLKEDEEDEQIERTLGQGKEPR